MERATCPRFFYHRPALSGQPAAPEIGGRPRCDVFIVRLVGIRKDMAPFDTMVHCVRQATCLAFHQSGAHPVRVGAVVVVPVAIGVHVQGVVGVVVGVRGAKPPVGGRNEPYPMGVFIAGRCETPPCKPISPARTGAYRIRQLLPQPAFWPARRRFSSRLRPYTSRP